MSGDIMTIYFEDGGAVADIRFEDQANPTLAAYWEDGSAPVFTLANPPGISHFGISAGSGNQYLLTIVATRLPIDITISADLSSATRWQIERVVGANVNSVAVGATQRAFYQEPLTRTFRPDSSGWVYLLSVWNGATVVHRTARVRVIRAPVLSSFIASAPVGVQTPGGIYQRSYLSWMADAGDPAAVWSLSQAGHAIAHLPSSSRLTPENGRAVGNSRQFVQTFGTPGASTHLTLTGSNEAGQAARSVMINWPGSG